MPQRAVAPSGHEILYVSRDGYSDHLPKHVRNFAAGGCHSSLWPDATAFLSHKGAYSWPETATVAFGRIDGQLRVYEMITEYCTGSAAA